MEEGPKVTMASADPENMKEVNKQDQFMKQVYESELGEDFESFENGVAIGEIRSGAMHPFDPTLPWPKREKKNV